MTDYAAARRNMVEGQVKPNGATDPVLLDALLAVPRERFVPLVARGIAYVDEEIPLGRGRWLLEPMVLARLITAAAVKPTDMVLDVACGTGYSTAVLARLAATVVGLESDPELARAATGLMAELAADRTLIVEGALAAGHAAEGPYDVILINGAVAELPAALLDQLAEGGRLVTVVAPRLGPGAGGVGRGTLFLKQGGIVGHRPLFEAGTPLLAEFALQPAFEF